VVASYLTNANKRTEIIHWGVAGPGHAGGRFAEGLRTVEGVTLDAIWGRTRERTQVFALRFGVRHIPDSLDQL